MMPPPMVLATLVPNTAKAMKLKKAAQNTATRGDSTRVETMVAIELAASCRPFRKSNASATAIRPNRTRIASVSNAYQSAQTSHAHRCSIRMPLMRLATSSNRSITFSR